MYDVNKCEWVSECTLLWKDACYLNKRPTIMCLAKKKRNQKKRTKKKGCICQSGFLWRGWTVQSDHSYCLFSMRYIDAHIFKRLKICYRRSLDYDELSVNQGNSSIRPGTGSMTEGITSWCHRWQAYQLSPSAIFLWFHQQQVWWFFCDAEILYMKTIFTKAFVWGFGTGSSVVIDF